MRNNSRGIGVVSLYMMPLQARNLWNGHVTVLSRVLYLWKKYGTLHAGVSTILNLKIVLSTLANTPLERFSTLKIFNETNVLIISLYMPYTYFIYNSMHL